MVRTDQIDFELKNDRRSVPPDLRNPLFVTQLANLSLANIYVGVLRLDASEGIIEEEAHAQ